MILFEQLINEVDQATAAKNIAEIVGVNLAEVGQHRQLEATYDYCDEDGQLLYQVLRYVPKDFSVQRPDPTTGDWFPDLGDTRKVLYCLQDVIGAAQVIVVEGEKDANALNAILADKCGCGDAVATTNPFGAGQWLKQYNECLQDKDVVVVPDMDKQGLKHAEAVCRHLRGVAASVRQVNLPEKDVSAYLERYNPSDLFKLIRFEDYVRIEA
jgi:5S rRNA maturation endonuclease (ribonuclease M5)